MAFFSVFQNIYLKAFHENTTVYGKNITAQELVFKAQYICSMQVDTNWYWYQQPKNHVITMPTRTILHPQLEGDAITDFHAIPTSICSRTQAKKAISRQPICLSDFDYNYILEEIDQRDKIEFEREIDVYSDDMED